MDPLTGFLFAILFVVVIGLAVYVALFLPKSSNNGGTGIGPTGPRGENGDRGEMGLQGIQGIQGRDGKNGVEGPAGIMGPPGHMGQQGLRGIPGPQGEIGERGEMGLQGSVGLRGAMGIQGRDGNVGAVGPTGQNGQPGLQGRQGVAGIPGPTGPSGPPSTINDFANVSRTMTTAENYSINASQNVTFNQSILQGAITFNGSDTLTLASPGFYLVSYGYNNMAVAGNPAYVTFSLIVNGNQPSSQYTLQSPTFTPLIDTGVAAVTGQSTTVIIQTTTSGETLQLANTSILSTLLSTNNAGGTESGVGSVALFINVVKLK